MNKYYVYRHYVPNTNRVFYIGMGKQVQKWNRSKSKHGRNKHWNSIVSKYGGFDVDVVASNLSSDEACELEIFLISEYGIENLSNKSLGGEGSWKIPSEESKRKISDSHKGVKLSKSHADAIRKSRKTGGEHWYSKKLKDTVTGEVYGSIKEAAIALGMKYRTLHAQIKGENVNRTNLVQLKEEEF